MDGHEVALDVGTNPIAGRVTAEDGSTRDWTATLLWPATMTTGQTISHVPGH